MRPSIAGSFGCSESDSSLPAVFEPDVPLPRACRLGCSALLGRSHVQECTDTKWSTRPGGGIACWIRCFQRAEQVKEYGMYIQYLLRVDLL